MIDLTKIPYCIDCGSPERAVYWGGGPRCQKCSDKFKAVVEAERQRQFEAEMKAIKLHRCGEEIEGANDICEECCEDHDYDSDEGYMCVHCGKEGAEDVACAAEAYWDARNNR